MTLRRWLLLLFVLSLDARAASLFDRAERELLVKKNYPAAERLYGRVARANPNTPVAALAGYRLGVLAYLRRDYVGARNRLARFLIENPQSPERVDVLFALAATEHAAGNYALAEEYISQARPLAEKHSDRLHEVLRLGVKIAIMRDDARAAIERLDAIPLPSQAEKAQRAQIAGSLAAGEAPREPAAAPVAEAVVAALPSPWRWRVDVRNSLFAMGSDDRASGRHADFSSPATPGAAVEIARDGWLGSFTPSLAAGLDRPKIGAPAGFAVEGGSQTRLYAAVRVATALAALPRFGARAELGIGQDLFPRATAPGAIAMDKLTIPHIGVRASYVVWNEVELALAASVLFPTKGAQDLQSGLAYGAELRRPFALGPDLRLSPSVGVLRRSLRLAFTNQTDTEITLGVGLSSTF